MSRRRFTRSYKLELIERIERQRVPITQAAQQEQIHPNVLRKWLREHRAFGIDAFPGHGRRTRSVEDVNTLRRALHAVTMERDILKKAIAYFASERA